MFHFWSNNSGLLYKIGNANGRELSVTVPCRDRDIVIDKLDYYPERIHLAHVT